jgi:signal transduction histidine kinase
MRDLVFEKFRQIDASHTRQHAGTGLGLAICRELAEMLQADLSLVSEPGLGASFQLTLPVAYRPPQPRSLMDEDP